jgi:hypothetical protein
MTTNTMASTSGTDNATTMPVRQPSARKLTKGMDELSDRMLDHDRLVGDLLEIEPLWHCAHETRGGVFDGGTELENVGALRHHHPDADGRFVFLPHQKVRRIGKTMGYRRNVAEAKHAAIGLNGCLGNGLCTVKRTSDAQRYTLRF